MCDDALTYEFLDNVEEVRPEPSSGTREEGTELFESLIRELRMAAQT